MCEESKERNEEFVLKEVEHEHLVEHDPGAHEELSEASVEDTGEDLGGGVDQVSQLPQLRTHLGDYFEPFEGRRHRRHEQNFTREYSQVLYCVCTLVKGIYDWRSFKRLLVLFICF
jgi:hypothetical protein